MMHPNKVNMFWTHNRKKIGVCYKNPCTSHLWDKLWSKENDGKKCFSCETKASISCILMRWMCFYSPIMKRMVIVSRIHVCYIYGINFDFKENNWKKSFSYKTKASISYILIRWLCFLAQSQKEWRLLWESMFLISTGWTLILIKW